MNIGQISHAGHSRSLIDHVLPMLLINPHNLRNPCGGESRQFCDAVTVVAVPVARVALMSVVTRCYNITARFRASRYAGLPAEYNSP